MAQKREEDKEPVGEQLRQDVDYSSPKQRESVKAAAELIRASRTAQNLGNAELAEQLETEAALSAETAAESSRDANPFLDKKEPMLHRQFDKGRASQRLREENQNKNHGSKSPLGRITPALGQIDQLVDNVAQESIENNGPISTEKIAARPVELDKKFRVNEVGNNERFYHKDTDAEAFRTKGEKIIVRPDSAKLVARDVTLLADSKGWTQIKVNGNEAFKREVWKEGNLRGIEVEGYVPTEQDRRDLDQQLNSIEAVSRDDQSSTENKKIAPVVDSGTVGDSQSNNPETTKNEAKRKLLSTTYREKTKAEAIKIHPELKDLFRLETAAKQFADNSIHEEGSKERFVQSVTDRGLDELSKGNELPSLKEAQRQQQVREHELVR